MHAKLFVIWLKNKIVMISFQVHIEHSCEKSLTGRGGYLFSRYDCDFFKCFSICQLSSLKCQRVDSKKSKLKPPPLISGWKAEHPLSVKNIKYYIWIHSIFYLTHYFLHCGFAIQHDYVGFKMMLTCQG